MKKIVVLSLGLFICNESVAGNFGLGVSLLAGDRVIYLPYKVSENLVIEPYFITAKSDNKNLGHESSNTYSTRRSEVGIGILINIYNNDSYSVYSGVRAGVAEQKNYRSYGYNMDTNPDLRSYYEKVDGYSISPFLGVEYELLENLTISGELRYYYSDLTGGEKSIDGISSIESSTSSSRTGVLIRKYF